MNLPHVDDDTCWCEVGALREATLDVLYPDRCQIPGGLDGESRTCVWPANHTQPCRGSKERPGDPCHYCGGPTDPHATGPGCSACWRPATIADIKAFAAEEGLQADVVLAPEAERP